MNLYFITSVKSLLSYMVTFLVSRDSELGSFGGHYPVLSGWALNVVTSILIRSRKRFDHRREGDMKTEAAIVVVRPQ